MSPTQASSSVPSNGIDFVDEDDTGSVPFSLKEEITHPGSPDPHKHLNEVRTTDAEKGNVSFTCNRPGQKCFTCSRGADEKNSFRDPSAKLRKYFWIPEKGYDFL